MSWKCKDYMNLVRHPNSKETTMNRSHVLLGIFFLLSLTLSVTAQDGRGPLFRSTPEAEGVSSEGITALINDLDDKINAMNSLMVLRHGKVIAECWWTPNSPQTTHCLYSLTKSFTSTAIGFAVAEGKLSLDDKVIDFFPDDLPEYPSENLKRMTVRSLLTMSCGHEDEALRPSEGSWPKAFLAHPVKYEPGTHFRYNTPGSYMLSAILQKVTGQTALDWLTPRLFEPLGIERPYWEMSPEGVCLGGQGLFMHTEDLAKFAQFVLQQGEWNGKQLLPKEWFEEATKKQISNGDDPESDWAQGYGFQFWRCRHNIFRGDGMYCQYIAVIPDKDMVIASTADSNQYQEILNLYWQHLLPAAVSDNSLPENPEALTKLKEIESHLVSKPGESPSILLRDQKIQSKILGREVLFNIYLPKNYLTYGGPWKTLYLLHGATDDHNTWVKEDRGRLEEYADRFFSENSEKKRIIVVPDAKLTWYRNNTNGEKERYEDFMVQELIPEIESKYRCASGRENRAVAGLSMGGYGSLLWTLHHPDLFSSCYAISAAVKDYDEENTPKQELENNIFYLADNFPEQYKETTRFFLDCGDDDTLLYGNVSLYRRMIENRFSVELRVRNGAHNWDYFSTALPSVFDFIDAK